MRLSNLKLKNFRNYHETKLEFSPNINVLIGENAQRICLNLSMFWQ